LAWNDIPAKNDPKFSMQVYYARINVLRQFLSPLNTQVFDATWEATATAELRDTHRSALLSELVGTLVQTLGLDEVSEQEPPVGGWFVHSGTTHYGKGSQKSIATLHLPGSGTLQGSIRRDCVITSSALANMAENDDTSFVVGRRKSATTFDLVAAGFRDPYAFLQGTARHLDLLTSRDPFGPERRASLLPYLVSPIEIADLSDEFTLAYAAHDTIVRFTAAVENEGVWKLLYDTSGEVLHETRHQALFRCFAQLSFAALGIKIHPNADHGRGPTDLTLTLGDAVHVVEFKKDTSKAKILHGLTVQLPLYMESARSKFGSYVVMCHENDKSAALEAMEGKTDLRAVINAYAIDCRPQRSASKA
jgi:hypothetical protein